MYCYIFDVKRDDWIESDSLFPHDVALLIDTELRQVYLYAGPKALKQEKEVGIDRASKILEKYAYELIILEDVIPIKVQMEIDTLMGINWDSKREKDPRTIPMQLFAILNFVSIALSFSIFINSLRMLQWSHTLTIYSVDEITFNLLFNISELLCLITVGISLGVFLLALITQRVFFIASSLVISGIQLLQLIFLRKGQFIFPSPIESLPRAEILLFLFVIFSLWIIYIGIICLELVLYYRETIKMPKTSIDIEELRRKSAPTILQDKTTKDLKELESLNSEIEEKKPTESEMPPTNQ